ncbi:hypothetical protein MKY24_16730 [Paenibacillus sp. FSL P2-0322]|uniref:hypothetical protein n=1 Tax=Paenibacillus sp. FSL P2-0322 TaxID=2921628 RepID=UPI0030D28690
MSNPFREAERRLRRLREEAERKLQEEKERLEREIIKAREEAEQKLQEEKERLEREARKAREEAERKLQEEKERLEREARKAREEAERKLQEEKERLEREAIKMREEAEQKFKEVEEAKNRITDVINNGAKNLDPKDVVKALDFFKDNIPPEITEKGKEYVAKIEEIKQQIAQIQDALDIDKLKRDVLRKAEEFCEEYLKEKLSFLTAIELKGVPQVHLDFDGKQISAEINVFVLLKDTEESELEQGWLARLSVHAVQEIGKLVLPDFQMKIEPNENFLKDKFEEIKKEIEAKKEELIAQLIMDILQDYLPPLRALNEVIKIFG